MGQVPQFEKPNGGEDVAEDISLGGGKLPSADVKNEEAKAAEFVAPIATVC